jgi:hypothetical protein
VSVAGRCGVAKRKQPGSPCVLLWPEHLAPAFIASEGHVITFDKWHPSVSLSCVGCQSSATLILNGLAMLSISRVLIQYVNIHLSKVET